MESTSPAAPAPGALNASHRAARWACALAVCALAGCSAVGPTYREPEPSASGMPTQWLAPAPDTARRAELTRWWTQLDDPALSQLIAAAQADSPTLAQAVARIRQARAATATARADQLPSVNASAGASRGNSASAGLTGPVNTTTLGLDASWEIDLFGGTRRNVEAADARLTARVADWHDARVTLAAEVANAYTTRRECEALIVIDEADLASRERTHRLTLTKLDAGFVAPADAQRTEASVAESRNTLESQRGTCAQSLNELVALTGLSANALQSRLAGGATQLPRAQILAIDNVPAQALRQRPDLASLERTLAAASAAIGVAEANRLPQLSLTGSISANRSGSGSSAQTLRPWSFGPSLTLPIFDGGAGKAAVESARGSYDEALGAYRAGVRSAVQEVENALVRVSTIARREGSAQLALQRYTQYFDATETQFRLGAASLLTLEEARRLMLTSQQSQVAAQLEQVQAWIALYKAVGGGWSSGEDDAHNNTRSNGS